MLPRRATVEAWRKVFLVSVVVLFGGCNRWSQSSTPNITFTRVPAADEGHPDRLDTIEGRASGVHPGQQIVLYAKSEEL
jgi:hypothetical protein